MRLFGTLSRRFGSLFVLVMAILTAVCAVAYHQLEQMRLDSARVMEETREQALCSRIGADIDSARALVESTRPTATVGAERATVIIARVIGAVDELLESADDPSREEHQAEEDKIVARLRHTLFQVRELIAEQGLEPINSVRALVEAAHADAEVLIEEAREEATEANHDLQERARATRSVLVVTFVLAALPLGLASVFVNREVARPIARLARGAEAFGRGDLTRRIEVSNRDEIGELADRFNEMAGRLAESQADLERRVEARTRQFLRAARLADLGLLASGIAHEINTPLATISSCAEGLQRRVERDELTPELLADYTSTIRAETVRAGGITSRMLALVREEPSELGEVTLASVLDSVRSAVGHRLEKRGVELACDAPAEMPSLHVNGGELVQILVNLIANAIDASESGGRIDLRVTVPRGRLELEVEDRGSGISAENQERIFDPFFTTKRAGEGTGLGLSLVVSLVQSHGGEVSVESEPGRGSVFRVVLPRDWRTRA